MVLRSKAIIGAGCSGIICARECLQKGLDVQIFEQFAHSGGMWVADKVNEDLQDLNGNTFQRGYESFVFSL